MIPKCSECYFFLRSHWQAKWIGSPELSVAEVDAEVFDAIVVELSN